MTLTKAKIAETIQEELGFPMNRSAELVETMLELMKQNLAEGDDILISGFGKFSVKQKRQRKGRNPATGEDMMLPARKIVTFKCSSVLRDRIAKP